jgi:transposase
MAITDGDGLPISISATSASPHEVTLVHRAIKLSFIKSTPKYLIGGKAYDSEKLDKDLKVKGIIIVAPHKRNRKAIKTQDGRQLRRYKRRWKVERLFAWLHNFRRIVVRYERKIGNFLGFVMLACMKILLRHF